MIIAPLLMLMQTAVLQPGPNPGPKAESALPIPRAKKARTSRKASPPEASPSPSASATGEVVPDAARSAQCQALIASDPAAAAQFAANWLASASSDDPNDAARRSAGLCLGMAQAALLQWTEAEQRFAGLARSTPAGGEDSAAFRALAGSAALAGGVPARALDWLDQAISQGASLPAEHLGGIQIDRARALVALGRLDEAGTALEEAHRLAPGYAEGWLLSATLHRRRQDLAAAQRDIEQAAALDPRDPAIGLEAGVISILAGRDAAARKSWESVIAMAPSSDEARDARGYIEQAKPNLEPTKPNLEPAKANPAPQTEKPAP